MSLSKLYEFSLSKIREEFIQSLRVGDMIEFDKLLPYIIDSGIDFKTGSSDTSLAMACLYSTSDVSKSKVNTLMAIKLIENGADVNSTSNDGDTPLIYASSSKHNYDLVKYLLEHGADPTKANNFNVLPFDRSSDTKIKNLLQSYMRKMVDEQR